MTDETGPVDEPRAPDVSGGPAETGPDTDPAHPDPATSRSATSSDTTSGARPVADARPRARPVATSGLALATANLLRSGTRLKVLRPGMVRHDLEGESAEGRYVSQFDSPVHGRMVVVHLPGRGNYGFRLDELQRVEV